MAAPTNRTFRGGYYLMDHKSFGAMMVSEQLRRPLNMVSQKIRFRARYNTQMSSGELLEDPKKQTGPSLADSYKVERGPLVDIKGPTGEDGPRITNRVVNRLRHAAAREFGAGGHTKGLGTRDLRRAGEAFGDLAGGPG